MKTSDDLNDLARNPGFRSKVDKNIIYTYDFIHSYDLGKVSGEKAKSCMFLLDTLAYKFLQNNYSKTWAAYYADLAKAEENSKTSEVTKAKEDAYSKLPEGLLENIHSDYALVKKCNELRRGYAIVYINDGEFSKVKSNAKKRRGEHDCQVSSPCCEEKLNLE